jgi:hypothetical protein
MRYVAAVLIGCIVSSIAHAESKTVGGWLLDTETDPFTDQTNVVALRPNNDRAVALRCLQGGLSIAIFPGKSLKEGDTYEVGLRVDHFEIFQMTGTVIGDRLIEVTDQMPEVIKQIGDGHQLAIRTVGTSVDTMTFSLANVSKVMTALVKACPLNVAPAKGDPL